MNRLNKWRIGFARPANRGFFPAELHSPIRSAAALMVSFALMLAVITRFTDSPNSGAQVTRSAVHQKLENKRQHIENTSLVRLVALADLGRTKPPAASQVVIIDPPTIKVFYGDDLYNRPPPFLS